ncbi:MAG: ABC transporter substrate-binding protein [Deltaproteobacteria bacterium]|nr:ABC transporter substrate-binding protein [Deltaproteobacteria bacterium]
MFGIFLVLALFGCGSGDKAEDQAQQPATQQEKQAEAQKAEPAKAPLRIGAVLRLSKGASDGIPAKHGIEIAVDMINAKGGINGRNLEILYYDSKDDATTAVNAVQKLISVDKVPAIIGPMMSGNVLAAAPLCNRDQVVLITPTGTSPKISEAGEFVFRICSRIDMQAMALVNKALAMADKPQPTVAIVYSNEPYGKGCLMLFEKYLAEANITPAAVESFQVGDKDFQSQLTKLVPINPDLLFFPGYLQETAPLLSQARNMGLTGLSVGVFGDMAPLYIELAGPAAENHIIAGEYDQDVQSPQNLEFVARYETKLKAEPNAPNNIMFAALTFDSVNILAKALESGATTGPEIQKFMAGIIDFEGVTGSLGFDENGDVQKGGIALFQVKDGAYHKVH